jgi:hypothetical protein
VVRRSSAKPPGRRSFCATCFPTEAGIVEELGRFIACERVCCVFLNFSLRMKAAGGAIWLELTGSDEGDELFLTRGRQRGFEAMNFPQVNRGKSHE